MQLRIGLILLLDLSLQVALGNLPPPSTYFSLYVYFKFYSEIIVTEVLPLARHFDDQPYLVSPLYRCVQNNADNLPLNLLSINFDSAVK